MVDSLIHAASRLEVVLLAGVSLAWLILLLKIFRQNEFEFANVRINLGYAWLVLLLFTVAHIYVAILFIRRCYQLFFADAGLAKQGWERLTGGNSYGLMAWLQG